MKILIEESVLRQALEAIGAALGDDKPYLNKCRSSYVAIESALDAAEKVEPVAWLYKDAYGKLKVSQIEEHDEHDFPVFTHPAQTTLVDSLAEKIAIDAREIEGWKAVADAGEKIIAARDEQIAELEEKLKQQIRFRGEALRERDELVAALKKLLSGCDTGERNPDGTQRGRSTPEKWQVDQAHAALTKVGADKTGEK